MNDLSFFVKMNSSNYLEEMRIKKEIAKKFYDPDYKVSPQTERTILEWEQYHKTCNFIERS